jgi:hypothetical protein
LTSPAELSLIIPVAEYDAFGRKVGEDTLDGIGGGSRVEQHEPAPVTVERRRPPAPRLPSRGHGIAVRRWLLALVVLGAVGAIATQATLEVGSGVRRAVEDVRDAFPSGDAPPATAEAPQRARRGLKRRTLVTRAGFSAALAQLRGLGARDAMTLVLRPDRLDAQLLRPDGTLVVAQVRPGSDVETLGTAPGTASSRGIRLASIRPAAPAHLARTAAGRLGVRPGRIDYLVLADLGDGPAWVAYFRGGRYGIGDARGRVQQVVG